MLAFFNCDIIRVLDLVLVSELSTFFDVADADVLRSCVTS